MFLQNADIVEYVAKGCYDSNSIKCKQIMSDKIYLKEKECYGSKDFTISVLI